MLITLVRRLVLSVFGFCLFAFLLLTTTLSSIRPTHIKKWLADSGVYNNAPAIVVDSMLKQEKASVLKDPAVQNIAKETFSPSFLQSTTEEVIDGTFLWLDQKATKPEFSVDLNQLNNTLSEKIRAYLKARYESLPPCTTPPTVAPDLFTMTCKPKGAFDIDTALRAGEGKFLGSNEITSVNVLSGDNFRIGGGDQKQTIQESFVEAPKVYKNLKLAQIVFGVIALLSALGVVFLSKQRLRGLRKVAITCLSSGVLFGVAIWAGQAGIKKAESKIALNDTPLAQEIALKFVRSASRGIAMQGYKIVVVLLAVSVVTVLGIMLYEQRNNKTKGKKHPAPSQELPTEKPEVQ